jgi:hypothetical protein
MSLFDEIEAEASITPPSQRSQIDVFLEGMTDRERADVAAWIESGKNRRALYRVLERRGLPVAESTFRNWTSAKCR